MNLLTKLPPKVTRAFGRLFLKFKKASPETCIIGGIACGGAALVLVGVETWKGKETLKADVDAIRSVSIVEQTVECVDDESKSAIVPVKMKYKLLSPELKKQYWARRIDFGKDILKIYWKPFVLGASATGLVWGGRTILRKELSASAAAYAALANKYNDIRKRIAEKYGKEAEQELTHGYKMIENVDAETKNVTSTPAVNKNDDLSMYAFYFDPGIWNEDEKEWYWKNYIWDRSKLANQLRIRSVQDDANLRLKTHGWVTLGYVAEKLGAMPDPSWYRVGWVWTEEKEARGENFIELGVLDGPFQLPFNKGFMDINNSQNVALIEPNVDGCIDYVFEKPDIYDPRFGRKPDDMRKRLPSLERMFGREFAKKLK